MESAEVERFAPEDFRQRFVVRWRGRRYSIIRKYKSNSWEVASRDVHNIDPSSQLGRELIDVCLKAKRRR